MPGGHLAIPPNSSAASWSSVWIASGPQRSRVPRSRPGAPGLYSQTFFPPRTLTEYLGPTARWPLDCACKEAVVLLASVPLLSGTTKPFSTADVMKAGKTAGFFGYGINGLFLPSQVMQAEKTFSSSFMKRPVRTMCGCVLPRHEKTSGCEPRLGWLRADHAISSPHFGTPS